MTDQLPPERLPCPIDGCAFGVTLPLPSAYYRPTWHPRLRREGYADETKEEWTDVFRQHLAAEHTTGELLEFVAWEPHRVWAESDGCSCYPEG